MSERDDRIYYNIDIRPSDDVKEPFPISFSETRTIPIVEQPNEYELAVVRFRVPLRSMPIFIWKPDTRPMFVQLEYIPTGDIYTEPLPFIPSQAPIGFYGEAVWFVPQFLDMINTAYANAFAALKAVHGGAAITEAPFITYDATTELVTWNVEQAYAGDTRVFMNSRLFYLFGCFPSISYPGQLYEIPTKDYKNNSATINGKPYYSTVGEFIVLPLWNDFQVVTFESDSIPVIPENLPAQTNVTRTVLTDFQPLDSINDRIGLQYYPQGPLRYYPMASKAPLRRIDVKVFWQSKDGTQYPFWIFPGDYFSMKLLFKKKDT